jgi:hypothetical protein
VKLYFDDEAFDGQLQRSVGKADSGMANVGECLAIAGQVTAGDRDSWYRAWSDFAERLTEQADGAAAAGHRVSARGAYLRAAEYFRHGTDCVLDGRVRLAGRPVGVTPGQVGRVGQVETKALPVRSTAMQ